MERNALVEALQREGNLKYSFNADEIESLAEHMSIEVIEEQSILMRKGEPRQHGVHCGRAAASP